MKTFQDCDVLQSLVLLSKILLHREFFVNILAEFHIEGKLIPVGYNFQGVQNILKKLSPDTILIFS